MNSKSLLLGLCLATVFHHGCIKDPPLNPEADVESVEIDSDQLTGNVFIDQINRTITLNLTADAFANGVAPDLKLSSGASVVPASGTKIMFDKDTDNTYTITSASGKNTKVYTVKVINVGNWGFDFENWQSNSTDGYEFPVESGNMKIWSSGNPGIALSGVPPRRDAYPTRSTTDGYLGSKGAELVTIKGTTLSELVGIKMFAGSLFLGDFNASQALLNPLAATEFGQPYVGLPDRFTGYYKYTSGPEYRNREGDIQPGLKDKCSIYAVLYNGPDRLNATNIMSSDKVIARAELTDGSEKSNFTRFEIPFNYRSGAVIGSNLMMAIVASSSADGNEYKGAIGSRLVVDSLRVIPKI